MRRYRLYCPNLSEGTIALSAEESRHALQSLRIRSGQSVLLFDGAGREAGGTVVEAGSGGSRKRQTLSVRVGEVISRPFELAHRVTLAVAMTKLPRQGYLIEKCTELGVETIWPITADHAVAKVSEAAVERWSRRAIEAAKQSNRAWIPRIAEVQAFAEALTHVGKFDAAGFADAGATTTIESLITPVDSPRSVLVFIGPEGGWSESERSRAVDAGLTSICLGPTILRTETAAVAVCALAALRGGPVGSESSA